MKKIDYSSMYAAQFAAFSIQQLVASFNHQVGNRGWGSVRAAHDRALMREFQKRGIDISDVHDGTTIHFRNLVRYDEVLDKIVVIR